MRYPGSNEPQARAGVLQLTSWPFVVLLIGTTHPTEVPPQVVIAPPNPGESSDRATLADCALGRHICARWLAILLNPTSHLVHPVIGLPQPTDMSPGAAIELHGFNADRRSAIQLPEVLTAMLAAIAEMTARWRVLPNGSVGLDQTNDAHGSVGIYLRRLREVFQRPPAGCTNRTSWPRT